MIKEDALPLVTVKRSMLVLGAVGLALMLFAVTASVSHAADPFLCPVVGNGVLNADAHNGDNGVAAIQPAVGTSFLPGNNQAGAHSNPNAHNTLGPNNLDAGPGHNPDFSPIWPAS